jgi:hypothetical protein
VVSTAFALVGGSVCTVLGVLTLHSVIEARDWSALWPALLFLAVGAPAILRAIGADQ